MGRGAPAQKHTYAICDEDVGVDDPGSVDKDGTVIVDIDVDLLTSQSGQICVAENSAVADGALDNMLIEQKITVSRCIETRGRTWLLSKDLHIAISLPIACL